MKKQVKKFMSALLACVMVAVSVIEIGRASCRERV